MGSNETFDLLVSGMSQEERKALLSRCLEEVGSLERPVFRDEDSGTVAESARQFADQPVLSRLLHMVIAFFTGKKPEESFKDSLLSRLSVRVEVKTRGLYDSRHGLLTSSFLDALGKVRDASDFFSRILKSSYELDRGALYAYLVSTELEEIHASLERETDPEFISKTLEPGREGDVKKRALAVCEEIVSSVSDDQRRKMYRYVRSIACLRRLSQFDFHGMLSSFESDGAGKLHGRIRENDIRLGDLANILYSMREPPSPAMIEAALVFQFRAAGATGTELEERVKGSMSKAGTAFAALRGFLAAVPLVDLARLAKHDSDWMPSDIPGGEDWFALWRNSWRLAVERKCGAWEREAKRRLLQSETEAFLGTAVLPNIQCISRDESESSPGMRLAYVLRFLSGFFSGPESHTLFRPLKILLLDGEFFKKENRIEYTDAFSNFQKVPENIDALSRLLSPDGELGRSWTEARRDVTSFAVRKKRMDMVRRSADEEGAKLVNDTIGALRSLVTVIGGVSSTGSNDRYDTLANLSYIDGKGNAAFRANLEATGAKLERMLVIMKEFADIEEKDKVKQEQEILEVLPLADPRGMTDPGTAV